jgi:sugar phosphate isomerase/epimerase
MKLGFLTACLPQRTLPQIAEWAAANDFDALEVAAWPRVTRPGTASHVDAAHLTPDKAEQVRAMVDRLGLELSALAYYDNNLHPDPSTREATHRHLQAVIDAAALLGCPAVGTFIGRDPTRTVAENLRGAERVFKPLVEGAGERGVTLMVENCPMEGWHPDGYPGNLAYSPELWEWMFSLGLSLNFDPSHLVWLGIDPVATVRAYLDRIVHAQAKDTELNPTARNRYGVFGKALRTDPWDAGWWRYRMPGLGEVDWPRLLDAMHEGGFTGVVSVEHEDPEWSGDEARIKTGLKIAHTTLRPLVVA